MANATFSEMRFMFPATLAIVCTETPDSTVGKSVVSLLNNLSPSIEVHLFTDQEFTSASSATVHKLPECKNPNSFASEAVKEWENTFGTRTSNIEALICGSVSIPTQLALSEQLRCTLLLDSINRDNRLLQKLQEKGIQRAKQIFVLGVQAYEDVKKHYPESASKTQSGHAPFDSSVFNSKLDPGSIKKRFKIGPIDPLILFIGPLEEGYGPDLIMKSVTAILSAHPQARFVFIGDGELLWPLKVHAHYLYLEDVVRLPGHLTGQALEELIQASDIVVVPSRTRTIEWPIFAAWASAKPLVVSNETTRVFCKDNENCLIVPPTASAIEEAVNLLLTDYNLGPNIAANGKRFVDNQFGEAYLARKLEAGLQLKTRIVRKCTKQARSILTHQPKPGIHSQPAL